MQTPALLQRLPHAVSLLLIFLFVYTAVSKLMVPDLFRFHLGKAPLIGPAAPLLVWAIPFAELALSLLLVRTRTRRAGLALSALLLGLFTLYLAGALLWGGSLPCGCGGVVSTLSWPQHLVLNTCCTALCLLALWNPTLQEATSTQTQPI